MTSTIAISVVIPAFNEEQLIANCLNSLKAQDFKLPFEIIVVDNSSQDLTVQIAKTFGVKVVSESNQGVVWARAGGLKIAQGEIIAQADADCEYPPNWLSLIYQHFNNSQVVAVGGPAVAQKKPLWAYWVYKYSFKLVNFIYQKFGKVIYLGGFNLSFRKGEFLQLGGYHTYLDFGGDEWDVLNRLKTSGKIVFEPKAQIKLSTRRYRVGFIKFWIIHAFYYYSLNYILAKIFKKTIIHSKTIRNI